MDGSEENIDDPSSEEKSEDDSSAHSTAKRAKKSTKEPHQKTFQTKWLSDSRFKGWLKAVPNDKSAAQCVACKCVIKGGNSELVKHSQRQKHIVAVKGVKNSAYR